MTINPKTYSTIPTEVEAIQITAENIEEVAKWCKSEIRNTVATDTVPAQRYIKVKVYRPLDDEQTKGTIGKWVSKRGNSFKVYTDKAFVAGFQDGKAIPMVDNESLAHEALFNGMVEELSQRRETHLATGGHEVIFTTPPAGVPMRPTSGDPNVGLFINQDTGEKKFLPLKKYDGGAGSSVEVVQPDAPAE
jgi:hypothetical protein